MCPGEEVDFLPLYLSLWISAQIQTDSNTAIPNTISENI